MMNRNAFCWAKVCLDRYNPLDPTTDTSLHSLRRQPEQETVPRRSTPDPVFLSTTIPTLSLCQFVIRPLEERSIFDAFDVGSGAEVE